MSSKLEYAIDKLEADNYVVWKWQMENVLRAKNLYEVVSSDIKEEEDESITRSNEQAMALIGSGLNRENKMLVVGCTSAHQIWSRLESIFENKTSFEKQELLSKLHSYKIERIKNVAHDLSILQALVSKLK